MPKVLTVAKGVAIAAVACVAVHYSAKAIKLEMIKDDLPKGFTVTAHTGTMGTKDNSLESIEVGAANADIIEFDVRFLIDGTPILSHNEPKNKDYITVERAFEALSKLKDTKANVDIKTVDNLPEVQSLAEKWGVLDRIFFTGVNLEFVEAVKRDCPKISYYLNFNLDPKKNRNSDYINSIVELVENSGAVGLNTNFLFANKKLVSAVHEKGLLVSLWTANKKAAIYTALSYKPDNLTSRNPDLVNEMLK